MRVIPQVGGILRFAVRPYRIVHASCDLLIILHKQFLCLFGIHSSGDTLLSRVHTTSQRTQETQAQHLHNKLTTSGLPPTSTIGILTGNALLHPLQSTAIRTIYRYQRRTFRLPPGHTSRKPLHPLSHQPTKPTRQSERRFFRRPFAEGTANILASWSLNTSLRGSVHSAFARYVQTARYA